MKTSKQRVIATACMLTLASAASLCAAQATSSSAGETSSKSEAKSDKAQQSSRKTSDTMQQVNDATKVVKRMESDPQLSKLLQQSKGVFIVPKYGRGGLIIGGSGGEGVMLANNNGKWSSPVFYNIGGLSLGAQVGAEFGSMAMILLSDKAVKNFMENNKFSLAADAGLTIGNYGAKAEGTAGRSDVVVWFDTKGAYADATVGVTDITFDEEDNRAFYKSTVAARDIISGKVKSAQAATLTQELSSGQ